jgi:hypothetical protein
MMLVQMGARQHVEFAENRTKGEHTMLVEMVQGNYKGYTKNNILKAKQARRAQVMMGNPSKKDYKGGVNNHLISNCPVTHTDITNAQAIFGPDLPSVRGKTVQWAPASVVTDYVAVPCSVVDSNKVVTLAADVFFVDGTAFLITMSRRIKFVTTEHIPVRMAKSLATHLDQVVHVYARAGFITRTILMDGKFEKVKDLVPQLECNTTAAKEHVSKAERGIQTIKECTRGVIATLPFKNIPRRMKIKFVYFVVLWLNAFPVRSGVSMVHLPRELLVQWKLDYKRHCRVVPGTYCKVHDEPLPSNTMVARTHEGIAVGPMGNLQGSVKFFCLKTNRILKRRSFTPLPMPDRVIKHVNYIGKREKQGCAFRFLNRRKEPYEWTDEVPKDYPYFQGLLEDMAPYPDVAAKLPGVILEDDIDDDQVVTDEPKPDFAELAATALENAGINLQDRLRAAQQVADMTLGPAVIKADQDQIVYEITFDLPDAGLAGANIVPAYEPANADPIHDFANETVEMLTDTEAINRRYPTQLRRSVDRYYPQTTFLQLEEVRVHRSVLDGSKYVRMTKEERVHTTMWTETTTPTVDDTEHIVDKELVTQSENEVKVWGYIMTQYNLKPGLRKFGERGAICSG